jgi:serine/threonine-protein kinase
VSDTHDLGGSDSLERLFEEFVIRRNEGEDLTIERFAEENPHHEEQILGHFPLMLEMERIGAGPATDPATAEGPPPLAPRAESRRDQADDYMQGRLRTMALVLAWVAGSAWVLIRIEDVLVRRFAGGLSWSDSLDEIALDEPKTWIHAALFLLLVTMWVVLRRRTVRGRWLPAVDALLLYATVALALAAWWFYEWEDLPFFFAFIVLFITIRAVVVPSSAWHTFLISFPVVQTVLYVILTRPPGFRMTINDNPVPYDKFVMETCLYGTILLLTVGVATAASRITFFLRKQIAETGRLGPYLIEEKIGRGGMGEVYRAMHVLLKRPTAVKLMLPGITGLRGMRRFEREVQQTCRLTHPNTIVVYDYGYTMGGVFYYAMELLDGGSLDAVVEEGGSMPAARAIHILAQACGALDEAHALGLIHRDIKPGNIYLCRRGREFDVVKVLDFGLVKDVRGDDAQLTQEGMYVGTPSWGAPEMISGRNIGPATDLYSLATVGYFLLTGRPVFDSETSTELIRCHLQEDPTPPSRLNPEVPADLEKLILHCLEKDPEKRLGSASALREALLECGDAGKWSQEDARSSWEPLS